MDTHTHSTPLTPLAAPTHAPQVPCTPTHAQTTVPLPDGYSLGHGLDDKHIFPSHRLLNLYSCFWQEQRQGKEKKKKGKAYDCKFLKKHTKNVHPSSMSKTVGSDGVSLVGLHAPQEVTGAFSNHSYSSLLFAFLRGSYTWDSGRIYASHRLGAVGDSRTLAPGRHRLKKNA